jgi:hypothetical protein
LYSAHTSPDTQNPSDDVAEQRFRGFDKLQGARFEIRATDLANLNPERFKWTTKLVFDVNQFAFEKPTARQENAQTLVVVVLDMHLAEPAGAHDMRNAEGIRGVRFLCPGVCQ